MKKLFPLFLLLCSMAIVTSCSKKEEINVIPSDTEINAEAHWQEVYDAAGSINHSNQTNDDGSTDSENGAADKEGIYSAQVRNIGKTHHGWQYVPQTTTGHEAAINKKK